MRRAFYLSVLWLAWLAVVHSGCRPVKQTPPPTTIASPLRPSVAASPIPVPPATTADFEEWRRVVEGGDTNRLNGLLHARPAFVFTNYAPGRSWLHLATDKGQEPVVALLIKAGAEVNTPSGPGWIPGDRRTPLHLAARNGQAQIVGRLLSAGADVNAKDVFMNSPLHMALKPRVIYQGVDQIKSQMEFKDANRIETVRLLCQAGADLFCTNRHREFNSPLLAASVPGQEHWLDLLLTNARPDMVKNPVGRSLVDVARQYERWEALINLGLPRTNPPGQLNALQAAVFDLLSQPGRAGGARPIPFQYNELIKAGQKPDLFTHIGLDDLVAVKSSLRFNFRQLARLRDPEGRSPLHWAVARGNPEMVKLLLDRGADATALDTNGYTPVQLAVAVGNPAVLQSLKPAVARALHDDPGPLSLMELAILKKRFDQAAWLLELHPDIQQPSLAGGTVLHLAVRQGPVDLVEKLLALGTDPKRRDHFERTPLHWAAAAGREPFVDLLLRAGAPLDAGDSEGRLPLHEAARLGHADIVTKLLPAANLVHTPDKTGYTPLELAMLGGQVKTVDLLLARKPDLQRRGPGGTNLLHQAVLSGKPELVARLLSAGVVPVVDDQGRTPLHTAAHLGDPTIVSQLLDAGVAVGLPDRQGKSALDLAVIGGRSPVINLLLKANKWSTASSGQRTTPLHHAVDTGNVAVLQELLATSPALTRTCAMKMATPL